MPDVSSYCPGCGESVHAEEATFTPATFGDTILAAFAYFAALPAIVLLLVPNTRRSAFVRFHAWQALLFLAAGAVFALVVRLLFVIFSILPSVGFLLAWLLVGVSGIAFAVVWVTLVLKAALGHAFELSVIGPVASHLAVKGPFASPS